MVGDRVRNIDTLEAKQQSLQMELDQLRDPQAIARKAQAMGMVLPSSPAVLDLRTGKVLGDPTPATGLDRLRLLPPPPVKPAELDPPAHVTVVQPPATTEDPAKNPAKSSTQNSTRQSNHHHRTVGHPAHSGNH